MKKRKHVFWETLLVVGSVLVFRSLWMLMDMVPFLNSVKTLVVLLFVGLIASGVGFYRMAHAH